VSDYPCQNQNRELWRQDMHDEMDPGNYYAPSVFVAGDGGIGIDVGGHVTVRPVREWAAMPAEIARLRAELEQARAERDAAEGWTPEFVEALDGVIDLAYDGKAHYLEPLHPRSVPAYQKDLELVKAVRDRQLVRGARSAYLSDKLKRSRETIRRLVVAARAMSFEGEKMIGWRQFVSAVGETIRDGEAKRDGEG